MFVWLKKSMSWILLNLPAMGMLIMLGHDPSLWEPLTPYTGYISLGLLVFVLALNPLQSAYPTSIVIKKMNKYRRVIGVAVVSYAALHVLCFYIKRGSLSEFLLYFIHPAIIPGLIALFIFILLAITSNNISIKKMGFIKWKKLHKFVYLGEFLILLHLILTGNSFWGFLILTPLVVLQYLRRKKRRTHQLRDSLAQGV